MRTLGAVNIPGTARRSAWADASSLRRRGERVIHFEDVPTSPAGIVYRVEDLLVALKEAYSAGAFVRAVVYFNEHLTGSEFRES